MRITNYLFWWFLILLAIRDVGGCTFELVKNTSCANHGYLLITTTQRCDEAVTLLGLSPKKAKKENDIKYPGGCYFITNQNAAVYVNLNFRSAVDCSKQIPCVCQQCVTDVPETVIPTLVPTAIPTLIPTPVPTVAVTLIPTVVPTVVPTLVPIPQTVVPTEVPPTQVPPTQIPSTPIPRTLSPNTSVPRTLIPTGVPTLVPVVVFTTSIPSLSLPTVVPVMSTSSPVNVTMIPVVATTSFPNTAIPIGMVSTQEVLKEVDNDVGTAAAVASIVSSGAASQASMVALLVGNSCDGSDRELPIILSPLQLTISDSDYVGAVIGNMTILIVVTIVILLASYIAPWGADRFFRYRYPDRFGFVRAPSIPLIALLALYQGSVFTSIHVVLYPEELWFPVCGIIMLILCIGIPIYVSIHLWRSVPDCAMYLVDPLHRNRPYLTFFIGKGEWVSCSEEVCWVQRWCSVLRPFKQSSSGFIILDFVGMLLLAVVMAPRTSSASACATARLFAGITNALMLCLSVFFWPHCRNRDNYADCLRLFLQSVASVFLSVGFYSEDPNHAGFPAGDILFFIVIFIVVIKLLMDMLTELYILWSGRRARIQKYAWTLQDEGRIELISRNHVSSGVDICSDGIMSTVRSESYDATILVMDDPEQALSNSMSSIPKKRYRKRLSSDANISDNESFQYCTELISKNILRDIASSPCDGSEISPQQSPRQGRNSKFRRTSRPLLRTPSTLSIQSPHSRKPPISGRRSNMNNKTPISPAEMALKKRNLPPIRRYRLSVKSDTCPRQREMSDFASDDDHAKYLSETGKTVETNLTKSSSLNDICDITVGKQLSALSTVTVMKSPILFTRDVSSGFLSSGDGKPYETNTVRSRQSSQITAVLNSPATMKSPMFFTRVGSSGFLSSCDRRGSPIPTTRNTPPPVKGCGGIHI